MMTHWDFPTTTLIDKCMDEGISASSNDVDAVNETSRPFLITTEPHQAVNLTLKCARELDSLIDTLDADFVHKIEEQGKTVRLDRTHHHNLHLAEIKTALGLN